MKRIYLCFFYMLYILNLIHRISILRPNFGKYICCWILPIEQSWPKNAKGLCNRRKIFSEKLREKKATLNEGILVVFPFARRGMLGFRLKGIWVHWHWRYATVFCWKVSGRSLTLLGAHSMLIRHSKSKYVPPKLLGPSPTIMSWVH